MNVSELKKENRELKLRLAAYENREGWLTRQEAAALLNIHVNSLDRPCPQSS